MESSTPLPKTVLSFIWHFLRPKWGRFLILFLCPMVWAFVQAVNPYVLKVLIDTIVNFAGDPQDVWSVAMSPVLIFLFLSIFLDAAMRLEDWIVLKTIPKIKAKMRAKMFDYVEGHSHRYFQEHLSGSLSNKVLDMVRAFENMVSSVLHVFFPVTVMSMLSIVLLWTVHIWFAIFVFFWFVIYIAVTIVASGRCIDVAHAHSEANSEVSGRIVDAFRNMATVRLFSGRAYENSYLNRYQKKLVNRAEILGKELFKVHLFQGIASTILFSLTLVLFVVAWQNEWVTVGDFTFVMATSFNLLVMTWWAAEQFVLFFKEIGVAQQALSLIAQSHEIVDEKEAKPLVVRAGKIEFDQVSFHYVPGKEIFREKTITIDPGEKVGLVGFSGSGKSTFVHLILRFFDLESGKILIDGQDISRVLQESLRDQIAMIPQDTMLFHRSLMDNIRYGKVDASDEEVIAASKQAHCHGFISDLEEGYESLVGEGGVKLSGGQRQRIAIARAVLKDGPILILDEATSSLDTATERKIQESLSTLMEKCTTIVIAHRLSTLAHLDRILVFDQGVIVESGTHQELLEKKGQYTHLWQLQVDGFLPD